MSGLHTHKEIVDNWLPRYTGKSLETFGEYIVLVNFIEYVEMFSELYDSPIEGIGKAMPSCTANGITIINFGMGSPNAAIVMDLLVAINPKAVVFLGKCGGLKEKTTIGDMILPIGAIRGEGTSNDYMPPEVPAMPAFAMQRAISTSIRQRGKDYFSGTVYTTNRRVWEYDIEFKKKLENYRCMAIDMETATLFIVGFKNKIPIGALLLISDQPMTPEGVKTAESDREISVNFVKLHLEIGIESLVKLKENRETVRHLKW
jgi:AMP nucleosidase